MNELLPLLHALAAGVLLALEFAGLLPLAVARRRDVNRRASGKGDGMGETAYWIESGGASRVRVECSATASESGLPCECPVCAERRAKEVASRNSPAALAFSELLRAFASGARS